MNDIWADASRTVQKSTVSGYNYDYITYRDAFSWWDSGTCGIASCT
jgi:hypothetical protein